MGQVFLMLNGDRVETTHLPDPREQVLPGIQWDGSLGSALDI